MTATQSDWQEVAAKKRAELLASIPSEWLIPKAKLPADDVYDLTTCRETCGILSAEELKITAASASEIAEKCAKGIWKAEPVAVAFCKAAAVAHQLTNCLTETLFEQAVTIAKSLDEHFAQTGKTVGPLHGVPISIKDNFNIKGTTASVGFVSLANHKHQSNSSLIDVLLSLGAVIYVKTNVPTAMMIAETVNNLYGRTISPLNKNLTPGGSSGGESALIAFKGSPIGVGSDIGGSVRIPAACCGLFGLRPSFGRYPHFDTTSGMAGQEAVPSVNGPLARTLEDITMYTKAVIDTQPWLVDPKCLPIPWRPVEVALKLKIAVLWSDGVVTPTPPVRRALATTVERLRKAGHEVVDWTPDGHPEALSLLARMFVADGGKSIRTALDLAGEPWRPEMKAYETASELGTHEMWQLHRERTALGKVYLEKWNACKGLDAILSPTTPYTSVKHGDFQYVGYTGIWNVLDYSALSFPTGLVADKSLDGPSGESLNELDAQVQSKYDPAAVHGMPISLQLIGRKLQEEKVLAMAQKVLDALA